MTRKEAYKILGLKPSATKEEILLKYRFLTKKAHLDGGGSIEKMSNLNSAKEIAIAHKKNMNKGNRNIIGLVGLIIAIIVLLFGNNLIERYTNSSVKETLEITGDWDEKKANKIVLDLMDDYSKQNDYDVGCIDSNCEIYSEIINHYWVDMAGKKSFVTIACTKTKDEMGACHSCPAPLSIFEFEKLKNGYNLNSQYINRQTLGKYGEPPERISVIPIGHDKFGIEIIDEFDWSGGDGIMTENYFIYCPIGDDLKEVLNIESKYYIIEGYPDANLHNWSTKISTKKEGTGYYDFEANSEGMSNGKKFNTIKNYRFNGIKYEEI